MSMLSAALQLAELGLRVFPVAPRGKAPALPRSELRGCLDATTDPDQIRTWWQVPNRNVGLAAGSLSGVIVVDVDGEEGLVTRGMWRSVHGLPDTVEAVTSKGAHLYFRHPGDQVDLSNSVKRIGDGIDVRVDGGYVVAPPSVHESGHVYAWAPGASPFERPFAPLPDWLLAKLVRPKHERTEYEPSTNHFGHTPYGQAAIDEECADLATTPDGERNNRLNGVAFRVGQLVTARHLSYGAAIEDVRSAAKACGLRDSETTATITSGVRAGMEKPNPKDPRPEELYRRRVARQQDEDAPPPLDDEAPEQQSAAESTPAEPAKPSVLILTAQETVKSALDFITDETRARMPRMGFDRIEDAIGGLAPGTMLTIGGRTGSGKSSLVLAMAMNQSKAGQRVGIVSCEDSEFICGVRLIATLREVNPKQLTKVPASEFMVGQGVRAFQEAADLGIRFAFPIGRPLQAVIDAVRFMVKHQGCNVIVVDYLQAIPAKGQDRYIARTDAAQALKGLCHGLGVPLVIASQLKRPETGNPFRAPTNNDLKDSGDIENMSESILLLWPTSDEERATVLGKVTKAKLSDERPKFRVERSPQSGAIVSLLEPPSDKEQQPGGVPRGGFYGED